MEKYGFELLQQKDCTNFNIPYGDNNTSNGLFHNMYKNMMLESNINNISKYGHSLNLETEPEIQKYSFFNRWFIFRKIGSGMKVKKMKVKK